MSRFSEFATAPLECARKPDLTDIGGKTGRPHNEHYVTATLAQ